MPTQGASKGGLGQPVMEVNPYVMWDCNPDGSACWGASDDARGIAAGLQRVTNVLMDFLKQPLKIKVDGVLGASTLQAVNVGLSALGYPQMQNVQNMVNQAKDIAVAFAARTKTTPNWAPVGEQTGQLVPNNNLPQPLPPGPDESGEGGSKWGWWVLAGSTALGLAVAGWYFLVARKEGGPTPAPATAGSDAIDADEYGYEEAVTDFIDV